MTDRELLELAAKAAGMDTKKDYRWYAAPVSGFYRIVDGEPSLCRWNPLIDNGDALRLAVKLQLIIRPQEKCAYVESNPESLLGQASVSELEMNGSDPYAATRRAIVRAAAEIGRG